MEIGASRRDGGAETARTGHSSSCTVFTTHREKSPYRTEHPKYLLLLLMNMVSAPVIITGFPVYLSIIVFK